MVSVRTILDSGELSRIDMGQAKNARKPALRATFRETMRVIYAILKSRTFSNSIRVVFHSPVEVSECAVIEMYMNGDMQDIPETIFLRLPETGFLRLPQVLNVIPLGKTCWWEGVKSGRFPKPVKLSKRCTAWRVEDIRDLITRLSRSSQNDKQPS